MITADVILAAEKAGVELEQLSMFIYHLEVDGMNVEDVTVDDLRIEITDILNK